MRGERNSQRPCCGCRICVASPEFQPLRQKVSALVAQMGQASADAPRGVGIGGKAMGQLAPWLTASLNDSELDQLIRHLRVEQQQRQKRKG